MPRSRASRSKIIWAVTTSLADWLAAVMSSNPTVLKMVTAKYSASVRVSWWVLKLAGAGPRHHEVGRGEQQHRGGHIFATVPEVAAIFRWDSRTLRRLIREGKIPAVAGDNAYRVPVAWLRAQAEAGE